MKTFALHLSFIILPLIGLSDYCWVPRAPLGLTDRYAAMGFTINNKMYVGCGYNGTGTNDFWEYDPATNTWTQKANYPGGNIWAGVSFAINGKGYVGLGTSGFAYPTSFYEYDPVADSWTQKANFPGPGRQDCHSFSINNTGYVTGGFNSGNYYNDFYSYDPITDTWTGQPPFPGTPRDGLRGFVIGNFAYLGTGLNAGTIFNDMYSYNSLTNTWSTIANLPGSLRHSACAFEMNTKGIMGGGFGATNSTFSDFYEYDPILNSWNPIVPFPGLPASYAVTANLSGNGYVSTGRSGAGTFSNQTWMLTDFQEATISGIADSCTFNVSFTSNVGSSDSCYWDFGDGTTSTLSNPVHSYTVAGNYNVTLTISNGSCNSSTSQTITIAPTVNSSFTLTSGCSSTVSVTNSSINASGFQWIWGDGQTGQGNVNSYTYAQPGTYTVSLIATNATCSDTSSQTITLAPSVVSSFTMTSNCSNTFTISNNSINAQNYQWTFGDGQTGQGVISSYTYSQPGTYTVSLIATDGPCTDTSFQTITLDTLPVANVSIQLPPCSDSILYSTTSSAQTYGWHFGDNTTGTNSSGTHQYSGPGTYQVILTISESGCTASDTSIVTISDQPEASFDYSLECNGALEVKAGTGTNWTYLWDFGDGNTGSGPTVNHNYSSTGTFPITLTVSDGNCADTLTKTITENQTDDLEQLFLPNAFTPNNDGINDRYCILDTLCGEVEMIIFNRWGSELFRTKEIREGWDGYHQNAEVPDGVYVVILDNDLTRKSSMIMLIR